MTFKTILHVEDNELNRKIVRDLLKRTTYRLIEAHDGEAGVAMAMEERPDLVLMDIQLPMISGLDATRKLRLALRGGAGLRSEGERGRGNRLYDETVQSIRSPGPHPQVASRSVSKKVVAKRSASDAGERSTNIVVRR